MDGSQVPRGHLRSTQDPGSLSPPSAEPHCVSGPTEAPRPLTRLPQPSWPTRPAPGLGRGSGEGLWSCLLGLELPSEYCVRVIPVLIAYHLRPGGCRKKPAGQSIKTETQAFKIPGRQREVSVGGERARCAQRRACTTDPARGELTGLQRVPQTDTRGQCRGQAGAMCSPAWRVLRTRVSR